VLEENSREEKEYNPKGIKLTGGAGGQTAGGNFKNIADRTKEG